MKLYVKLHVKRTNFVVRILLLPMIHHLQEILSLVSTVSTCVTERETVQKEKMKKTAHSEENVNYVRDVNICVLPMQMEAKGVPAAWDMLSAVIVTAAMTLMSAYLKQILSVVRHAIIL